MATTKKDLPKEILVHYIKTPSYRTYHVDGAYGGITPNGNIYCEFFIDRNVTPKSIVYNINDKGRLGKPKKVIGKKGIVREIECGIAVDIRTARALKNWLEDKIKEYDTNVKSFKGK
jgi:hypothetical protein